MNFDPVPLQYKLRVFLNEESKSIPINLGLLNKAPAEMASPGPLAKVSDVPRVQADRLPANFVQFLVPQNDFGPVHGGREDAELRHISHLEGGAAVRSRDRCRGRALSLGDNEIGA